VVKLCPAPDVPPTSKLAQGGAGLGAEDAGENRVHMFGVIAKIEFVFDFFHGHGGRNFWIRFQFCQEISPCSQTRIALRCTRR